MEILNYTESLKDEILKLNIEWLEKHFIVEPIDLIKLSDPKKYIINKGGHIYFASSDNEIVGTVTLMKLDDNTYEVGKMAVTEKVQGQGIGDELLTHCLNQARKMGVKKLILYSNTKLTSAINLYKKYNFSEAKMDKTHYKRANIKMEYHIG